MADAADTINAAGGLLQTIAQSSVFKLLLFGLGCIVLYTLYEFRAQAAVHVVTSPPLMILLAVATLMSMVGYAFRVIVKRVEEARSKHEVFLMEQIEKLEVEVKECKADCKEEAKHTHEEIKAALSRIERLMGGKQDAPNY